MTDLDDQLSGGSFTVPKAKAGYLLDFDEEQLSSLAAAQQPARGVMLGTAGEVDGMRGGPTGGELDRETHAAAVRGPPPPSRPAAAAGEALDRDLLTRRDVEKCRGRGRRS